MDAHAAVLLRLGWQEIPLGRQEGYETTHFIKPEFRLQPKALVRSDGLYSFQHFCRCGPHFV